MPAQFGSFSVSNRIWKGLSVMCTVAQNVFTVPWSLLVLSCRGLWKLLCGLVVLGVMILSLIWKFFILDLLPTLRTKFNSCVRQWFSVRRVAIYGEPRSDVIEELSRNFKIEINSNNTTTSDAADVAILIYFTSARSQLSEVVKVIQRMPQCPVVVI
eukprot:c8145_g1_i2.p1 GENE.c8145_g1_i2~~c8145_g1_i2.p1  ORF type:complete len:168 (+),score=29.33 c8145_g1_i2:35-505(+)